jgi:hypothetical protein
MFGTECFSGYDSQCCRYGEHGLGADEKTMRRAITNIVDFTRRLSQQSPVCSAPPGLVNVVEHAIVHELLDVWHVGILRTLPWTKLPSTRLEVVEFRNQLTFDMGVVDLRMEDLLTGQVYEEVDFAVAWEVEQVFQLTSPAMPSAKPEYWVKHEAL